MTTQTLENLKTGLDQASRIVRLLKTAIENGIPVQAELAGAQLALDEISAAYATAVNNGTPDPIMALWHAAYTCTDAERDADDALVARTEGPSCCSTGLVDDDTETLYI